MIYDRLAEAAEKHFPHYVEAVQDARLSRHRPPSIENPRFPQTQKRRKDNEAQQRATGAHFRDHLAYASIQQDASGNAKALALAYARSGRTEYAVAALGMLSRTRSTSSLEL